LIYGVFVHLRDRLQLLFIKLSPLVLQIAFLFFKIDGLLLKLQLFSTQYLVILKLDDLLIKSIERLPIRPPKLVIADKDLLLFNINDGRVLLQLDGLSIGQGNNGASRNQVLCKTRICPE